MPALIPMQRSGSRATFPSRDPTFAGARASSPAVKMLTPFEPTRRRNRPEALSTCVRPYERTSLPAWHQEPTNWCHGYPAGHACSPREAGRPPSSPDGRRWPNPTFRPLMATFLMLLRSRGAIGRVRATPGPLPTAGRRKGHKSLFCFRPERVKGQGEGPGLVNSSQGPGPTEAPLRRKRIRTVATVSLVNVLWVDA